ncbi:MAG: 1,4-dihydroxy-2-naphthoate octaprenyltransferase [Flavobacteriaceae bacterium]|nr:1,4-dihydroxy-2-naphthoate octaprenyltransferase [Flavobacteriaceae bacterium]
MANLKAWISAARLRTLPLSISGALVGSAYAFHLGFFNTLIFSLIILTTLSFQILSNFANDYGDGIKGTDNESRIGPKRALQSGAISPSQMRTAVAINALISAILSIALILVVFGLKQLFTAAVFVCLGGLSIYAAITYTVGKSAYGYNALGDLMVFLFFGFLSVLGTFFLFTKQIEPWLFLPASSVGLLSAAVLNLNNMRDLESDRKSKKNTLAGYFGPNYSKVYHFSIVLLAIIFMLVFVLVMPFSYTVFFSCLAFIPLLFHLKSVYYISNPKEYDPHLKTVALSTFTLALLFALGIIFGQ